VYVISLDGILKKDNKGRWWRYLRWVIESTSRTMIMIDGHARILFEKPVISNMLLCKKWFSIFNEKWNVLHAYDEICSVL